MPNWTNKVRRRICTGGWDSVSLFLVISVAKDVGKSFCPERMLDGAFIVTSPILIAIP
jgi:hypothetical protein